MITTVPDLVARLPRLDGAWIVGIDVRQVDVDWSTVHAIEAVFAGCTMDGPTIATLNAAGALLGPQPSLYVAKAAGEFGADGSVEDEKMKKRLHRFVETFAQSITEKGTNS